MHEGKILKYLSRNTALCTLACCKGGGVGGAEKNFMSLSQYVLKSQNINTVTT